MDSSIRYALTQLPQGRYLRLHRVDGRSIAVFKGTVWITQDGDPRDVFVGPGETFFVDRPGLVLIEALDDASLIVLEPQHTEAHDERAVV